MLGNTKTNHFESIGQGNKELSFPPINPWIATLFIYYVAICNAFISLALHSLSSLFCSTVLSEKDFKFVAR